jgi:hypothetical protein
MSYDTLISIANLQVFTGASGTFSPQKLPLWGNNGSLFEPT